MSGRWFASVGAFATKQARAIVFLVVAMCLGGLFSAARMPSSVFPRTDFPRVVILVDNGVMPADEMMARVTRPIEEAMKDIPGAVSVKSGTGRGAAEINVFFDWSTDMVQSELYVLGRLSQIRSTLPPSAQTNVSRLTFSAFPILGISVTSTTRDITALWEKARYDIKPRFLRIPGVARVDLVGGRMPEYQVLVDMTRLGAVHLTLPEVIGALEKTNLIASVGMHEENNTLYLTVVDGRVHSIADIAKLAVAGSPEHATRIEDFAEVKPGPEPVFNRVTADGVDAVLLNIRSQPNGSTLAIAEGLQKELTLLRSTLPPDIKLAFFYDQSLLVRDSVDSVWEAIGFGLLLSVVILYAFLRNWGTTLVATLVIPVTVLFTLVVMRALDMSFNLMTLGGIAAAIGLVVDDAIVVVEAIYSHMMRGKSRVEAIHEAIVEIFTPLVGSTLTPVVVFVPLAFLDGLQGVFFRALATTMVVSLLTSLLLAVTLTPTLAGWIVRVGGRAKETTSKLENEDTSGVLAWARVAIYERALRKALAQPVLALVLSGFVLLFGAALYLRLDSDFLPAMDEGAFVIDYHTPPGTSLTETNRALVQAETILRAEPEVESYSRRTGARLALAIAEPNTGDFLVKLKPARKRKTEAVISDLRKKLNVAEPVIHWEFPGILSDLIGDLMWAPEPIEIKIYSTDTEMLRASAPRIEEELKKVKGVVDTFDGLVVAGPTLSLRVRADDAQRFGMNSDDIAQAVNAAVLGQIASSVLEGDRFVNIRVRVSRERVDQIAALAQLPIAAADGRVVLLSQVADLTEVPGELERRREDLRQDVAITARLEGRDLGSAIDEIKKRIDKLDGIPSGSIEYGGLYEQQQRSFRSLLIVLGAAVFLVFTVLLLEFGSFKEPIAIVFGAVLSLFGSIAALAVTGTSLNIVSFLGAIIGVGIVAKNGILVLDRVEHLRASGRPLEEAIVESGKRRLRPVLMTSLAGGLGMLPLAVGIGSGADMLKPLAIAVIGALLVSYALSLIVTPTLFYLMSRGLPLAAQTRDPESPSAAA